MAVGLREERRWWGLSEGRGDGARGACHVGGDIRRGVSKDNDCAARRKKAGTEDAFRLRFDRRHPLGGEKRAPA